MTEIRCCPMCHKDKCSVVEVYEPTMYRVECPSCGYFDVAMDNAEDAIRLWNEFADRQERFWEEQRSKSD